MDNYFCEPSVQQINRVPNHTMLHGFTSINEAQKSNINSILSSFVDSFDGKWGFSLHKSFLDAVTSIEGEIDDTADIEPNLQSLVVPGNWQLQNINDKPIYTNIKYIIPVDPPNIPFSNPCGCYFKTIFIANIHQNRSTFITFHGVDSAFYLWINDSFCGLSKDSRLPAEFDITNFIQFEADNCIRVLVTRYSDGFYLEDQDMWNLSGIFRSVEIHSLPSPMHIQDFK